MTHTKTGLCPICLRPSEGQATVCDGCRKRRQRGKHGPSQERLPLDMRRVEAAIALAEADSDHDAEFNAALRRLDRAYEAMLTQLGWRPPSQPRQRDRALPLLDWGGVRVSWLPRRRGAG